MPYKDLEKRRACARAWWKRNKDKRRAYAREWRTKHPILFKRMVRRSLLRRHFGLSEADYQKLFKTQRGKCALCGKPETRRIRGKVTRLVIDHDHKSGAVRALLCHKCNAGLGQFNDSLSLLLRAARYVERHA